MTKSAIILAGGFGTRLQSVVKDVPKPMADINGKPFLGYVFDYLLLEGITHAILSVGYKCETIRDYFGNNYGELSLSYSVEDAPLGTGGAILKAVNSADENEFFVLNGDTFFGINLSEFYEQHLEQRGALSLALKQMHHFDRYGVVITNEQHVIQSFEEKKFYERGNINGGIYLLNRNLFEGLNLPEKFSFEKDVMEQYCHTIQFHGYEFNDYFIDIGIPEDYDRAQRELPPLIQSYRLHKASGNTLFPVDQSWTLFLDRDGVINKKIDDDYVRHMGQFEWLPGVQQAIKKLSAVFGRIIIVSNQQGVGKGLMRHEDVISIHQHIKDSIADLGGRLDNIYYAPQLKSENSAFRKPNTGMAIQAKKDFPEIDFEKSIMVGDSMSDMEFGKNAGMKTVFILNGKAAPSESGLVDFTSENLVGFSKEILRRSF